MRNYTGWDNTNADYSIVTFRFKIALVSQKNLYHDNNKKKTKKTKTKKLYNIPFLPYYNCIQKFDHWRKQGAPISV